MHLFGVADGHGQFGHEVADYATTMLGLILKVQMIKEQSASLIKILKDSYRSIHTDLKG